MTLATPTVEQEFAEQLWEQFEQVDSRGSESLWLIHWIIEGNGPLFTRLQHPRAQRELLTQFETLVDRRDLTFAHTCQFDPSRQAIATLCERSVIADDFFQRIEELPTQSSGFSEVPAAVDPHQWREWTSQLDTEAVAAEVRRLGVQWFDPVTV